MVNIAEHLNILMQRMIVKALGHDDELEGYIDSLHYVTTDRNDAVNQLGELAGKLYVVRASLRDANTRAAKNAALALLAFGLIAVEIHAVVLYFLPK